ncbi:MAG: hypothetical protein M3373_10695 [Gemmatimonadota bacterium]|nr:hypothetical protein [Gemmatimonadota bacterium]
MSSVDYIYAQHRKLLASVPPTLSGFVCDYCLGPMDEGYTHCYGCKVLFHDAEAPLHCGGE